MLNQEKFLYLFSLSGPTFTVISHTPPLWILFDALPETIRKYSLH